MPLSAAVLCASYEQAEARYAAADYMHTRDEKRHGKQTTSRLQADLLQLRLPINQPVLRDCLGVHELSERVGVVQSPPIDRRLHVLGDQLSQRVLDGICLLVVHSAHKGELDEADEPLGAGEGACDLWGTRSAVRCSRGRCMGR